MSGTQTCTAGHGSAGKGVRLTSLMAAAHCMGECKQQLIFPLYLLLQQPFLGQGRGQCIWAGCGAAQALGKAELSRALNTRSGILFPENIESFPHSGHRRVPLHRKLCHTLPWNKRGQDTAGASHSPYSQDIQTAHPQKSTAASQHICLLRAFCFLGHAASSPESSSSSSNHQLLNSS